MTSAELLARFNLHAGRPSTDTELGDPDKYLLLEEAQQYWVGQFAVHFPEQMYGAPVKLETSDSGATYTVPSGTGFPLGHMEIRASRTGPLLRGGPEWDPASDFTQEGDTIRIPDGKTRTFDDGPYARFVEMPGTLNAANEPTLQPAHARILIVDRALVLWAQRGGRRDPMPYLMREQRDWAGDPNIPGDSGIMGQLKTQFFQAGNAREKVGGAWYQSRDFSG